MHEEGSTNNKPGDTLEIKTLLTHSVGFSQSTATIWHYITQAMSHGQLRTKYLKRLPAWTGHQITHRRDWELKNQAFLRKISDKMLMTGPGLGTHLNNTEAATLYSENRPAESLKCLNASSAERTGFYVTAGVCQKAKSRSPPPLQQLYLSLWSKSRAWIAHRSIVVVLVVALVLICLAQTGSASISNDHYITSDIQ